MNNGMTKGEVSKPVSLLRLMNQIGPSRTARSVGVSTTTLYKARKTNKVAKVIETAAAGVLAQEADIPLPKEAKVPDLTAFIIEIPPDKVDIVTRFVEMAGAKLTR